jgi:hypothetical protein
VTGSDEADRRLRPRPGFGRHRARVRCLLAAILVLSVFGCGASSITPVPSVSATPRPTATPTLVPSPSPTATPTATPTLQPGFVQTTLGLVWNGQNGEQLNVPAIPGLSPTIGSNGQTVQYTALASNPYGLLAGAIGAYFNPLVSVSGKQVGGVALEAHVATWYLQHTADVDGIPPILSPVDLRTATGVSISNGTFVDGLGNTDIDIEVAAAGTATLTDILPGTRTIAVQKNPVHGTAVYDPSSQSTAGGDKWSYLGFFVSDLAPLAKPATFSLGQVIGTTTEKVVGITSAFNQVTNINTSAMLRIGNSPVSAFQQGG